MKNKIKKFTPKSHRLWLRNPRVLIACIGLAILGTMLLINSKAATYCDIAPASTNASIDAAIAGCANGSTIRFPLNASYTLPDRILVRDRSDLVIDGNGSTFTTTAPNDGAKIAGNWVIVRGVNIHIKNMKIIGNFHLTGTRSQQRVNEAEVGYPNYVGNQFNMGVGLYGGNGLYVTDMTIDHVFGDGVAGGRAHYIDGSISNPLDSPTNTHIERVHVTKTARHCFSPSISINYWLEDSSGTDCWYGAMDAELDNTTQKLQNIHVLRNTFSGYFMFGIAVPVAGDDENTRDIEIRDNTFLTRPDNSCNSIIMVGIYPTNPNTLKNVIIENNTFASRSGHAVEFDHVAGGSIQNNKDAAYTEAGCSYPNATQFHKTTNSSGVTISNNTSSAPGASSAVPPPPSPTPTPSPSPTPEPTPQPPSDSTLTAPANLTGVRVSASRIDLDWEASGGPVISYYIWRNNAYLGAVHASTGETSFSDTSTNATSSYSYFVRAGDTADNTKDSNTVTVGPMSTTTPTPITTPTPPADPCGNRPLSDLNCDGRVDAVDISVFRQKYKANDPASDANGDGTVNAIDISSFRARYKSGT